MTPADLETPRGLAMGSGVRSSAMSTAAMAYNPAALPFGKVYHIESFNSYVPQLGRWMFGGNIVDSMTSRLAAGLSFRGILGNDEEGYSGMDGRLALGFPLMDQVSIGISGRYLSLGREGQAPVGVDPNEPLAEGFTMDGSIVVVPTEGLTIAALAKNFIDIGSDLTPVQFGGSASYTVDGTFTLGADVLVDISTFEDPSFLVGGGAEFLAGGVVPIRAGYFWDEGRDLHGVTGGLGYVDENFGIDVSLRQYANGNEHTEIMLGARYFVQ